MYKTQFWIILNRSQKNLILIGQSQNFSQIFLNNGLQTQHHCINDWSAEKTISYKVVMY